jgi:hypothetical protein
MSAVTIRTWKAAALLLSDYTYQRGAETITILPDWRAALNYIRNSEAGGNDSWSTTSIPCEVRFSAEMSQFSAEQSARHYLEHFFSDVFLALNLAAPGCCNFWVAKIPHSIPPCRRFKAQFHIY